jgi:hypothetical protein
LLRRRAIGEPAAGAHQLVDPPGALQLPGQLLERLEVARVRLQRRLQTQQRVGVAAPLGVMAGQPAPVGGARATLQQQRLPFPGS